MEAFQTKHGVRMIQGWGMTETSPLAAVGHPPKDVELGSPEELDWRAHTGRVVPGVELRIVADDGTPLPYDGEAVGEIEVRGPWITGSYYATRRPRSSTTAGCAPATSAPSTSAATSRSPTGPRTSSSPGGEWISSVELEGHLMAHPRIVEAAVIGVPDPRWDERPLACVVVARATSVTIEELARVPRANGSRAGRFPSVGRSSTRCPRPASASSTRRCCGPVTRPASSPWTKQSSSRRARGLTRRA